MTPPILLEPEWSVLFISVFVKESFAVSNQVVRQGFPRLDDRMLIAAASGVFWGRLVIRKMPSHCSFLSSSVSGCLQKSCYQNEFLLCKMRFMGGGDPQ